MMLGYFQLFLAYLLLVGYIIGMRKRNIEKTLRS